MAEKREKRDMVNTARMKGSSKQFATMSHDSESSKPKKTCSCRLLGPPATPTWLCDLGVAKCQERECGKAWIGSWIKMDKDVLKC